MTSIDHKADKVIRSLRIGFGFVVVFIIMLIVAMIAVSSDLKGGTDSNEAEHLEFVSRWNSVADEWNSVALDLKRGIVPRARMLKLDKNVESLRKHRLWLKEESKCR